MTPSTRTRWPTAGWSPASRCRPPGRYGWSTSDGHGKGVSVEVRGGVAMTRVAVVTGGASGMGEATCHELGRRGYRVAVMDMNVDAAQRVTDDLRGNGITAVAAGADVT